jgi:protein-tyrosine phosphatase
MAPLLCDLHCHLLPGLDDGPATLDETLETARAQVRAGVERVVCTPHSSPGMSVSAARMHERVAEVRAALAEHGIPLAIETGAEVAMTRLPDLDAAELAALALAGGGWILLEAPTAAAFPVERAVEEVHDQGLGVVLAHPERCRVFQEDPARLRLLVDRGARVSITASALTGSFGRTPRACAEALVAEGLVHNAASDAHGVGRRPPDLVRRLAAAGLGDRVAPWCRAFPEAILGPAAAPPAAPGPDTRASAMAAAGASERDIEVALAGALPAAAARRMARRALRHARAAPGLQESGPEGDT